MKKSTFILGAAVFVLLIVGGYVLYMRPVSVPAAAQPTAVARTADSTSTASESAEESTSRAGGPKVLTVDPSGATVDAKIIATVSPPPIGYIEYRNAKYGLSFYHTPEGKITEYDEGGGAMTITLENEVRARGMQVFIVPYAEATISEKRFHDDVPSGVRTNVENGTLDGVRSVTFNSFDDMLGETREIWVIRNGYLYEITTFKGVANWFTPIIQSWRFF